VLSSHRALVLHSFAQGIADSLGIGERDVLLPIVPMCHVNAWGLPFTGVLFGAGQVLPGPYLDGASVLELSALRAIARGGSAAPASMIRGYQERHTCPSSTPGA